MLYNNTSESAPSIQGLCIQSGREKKGVKQHKTILCLKSKNLNSLKLFKDTYGASLKWRTQSVKQILRSSASDKKKLTTLYNRMNDFQLGEVYFFLRLLCFGVVNKMQRLSLRRTRGGYQPQYQTNFRYVSIQYELIVIKRAFPQQRRKKSKHVINIFHLLAYTSSGYGCLCKFFNK